MAAQRNLLEFKARLQLGTFALAAVLALSAVAALSDLGQETCAAYLAQEPDAHELRSYVEWVANRLRTSAGGLGPADGALADRDAIGSFLPHYCRAHPDERIVDAANDLASRRDVLLLRR
jgi:hypothetical protein